MYKDTGYTLDPHSAVGMHAALIMAEDDTHGHIISLACAHPAKFPDAVEKAINTRPNLPEHLTGLFDKDEHYDVIENDVSAVQRFIQTHA